MSAPTGSDSVDLLAEILLLTSHLYHFCHTLTETLLCSACCQVLSQISNLRRNQHLNFAVGNIEQAGERFLGEVFFVDIGAVAKS